jgi:hypothetical protein
VEITAKSGPVVVVSLRRIGARGALYVECRIGARGARYVTGYSIVKINYKTNTTLRTLNKVASQKKKNKYSQTVRYVTQNQTLSTLNKVASQKITYISRDTGVVSTIHVSMLVPYNTRSGIR